MVIVVRNTYPKTPGIAHAAPGDRSEWKPGRGSIDLVRKSDGKSLFSIGGIDRDGKLYSTGKPPILVGIIGQVKSKMWVFEVAHVEGG